MSVSCTKHENMSDSGSEAGGPYGNNLQLFAAIRIPFFDEVKRHQSRAGKLKPAPTGRSAYELFTRLFSLHTEYLNTQEPSRYFSKMNV